MNARPLEMVTKTKFLLLFVTKICYTFFFVKLIYFGPCTKASRKLRGMQPTGRATVVQPKVTNLFPRTSPWKTPAPASSRKATDRLNTNRAAFLPPPLDILHLWEVTMCRFGRSRGKIVAMKSSRRRGGRLIGRPVRDI